MSFNDEGKRERRDFSFRELSSGEEQVFLDPSELTLGKGKDSSSEGEQPEEGNEQAQRYSYAVLAYLLLGIALSILLGMGVYRWAQLERTRAVLTGKLKGRYFLISPGYYKYCQAVFGEMNCLFSLSSPVIIYFSSDGRPESEVLEDIPSVDNKGVIMRISGITLKLALKHRYSPYFFQTYKFLSSLPRSNYLEVSLVKRRINALKQVGDQVVVELEGRSPFPYLPFNFLLTGGDKVSLAHQFKNGISGKVLRDELITYEGFPFRVITLERRGKRLNLIIPRSDEGFKYLLQLWAKPQLQGKAGFILTLRDLYENRESMTFTGMKVRSFPSFNSYLIFVNDQLPIEERRCLYTSLKGINWSKLLKFSELEKGLNLQGTLRTFEQSSWMPPTHYAYFPIKNHHISDEGCLDILKGRDLKVILSSDVLSELMVEGLSEVLREQGVKLTILEGSDSDLLANLRNKSYHLAVVHLTYTPFIAPSSLWEKVLKVKDEELVQLDEAILNAGYSQRQIYLYHQHQELVSKKGLAVPLFNQPMIYISSSEENVQDVLGTAPLGVFLREMEK